MLLKLLSAFSLSLVCLLYGVLLCPLLSCVAKPVFVASSNVAVNVLSHRVVVQFAWVLVNTYHALVAARDQD